MPFLFNFPKIDRRTRILIAGMLILFPALMLKAEPRTWTSKDGRTLQAEYVSSTDTTVTALRTDGQKVVIPLAALSPEDVTWVSRQPKPVEITQKDIDALVAQFPRPAALSGYEVTNDLKQLHDKYESLVKFIRPHTLDANLKMIRGKVEADLKIFGEIAKTSSGDWTGKRGSSQSRGAENTVLSARAAVGWLNQFEAYLKDFDALKVAR
jgi:hypothetical protein